MTTMVATVSVDDDAKPRPACWCRVSNCGRRLSPPTSKPVARRQGRRPASAISGTDARSSELPPAGRRAWTKALDRVHPLAVAPEDRCSRPGSPGADRAQGRERYAGIVAGLQATLRSRPRRPRTSVSAQRSDAVGAPAVADAGRAPAAPRWPRSATPPSDAFQGRLELRSRSSPSSEPGKPPCLRLRP